MSKANEAAGPKLQTVTLLKPHTHNEIDYAVGDKIEVNEVDKAFLVAHQIIAAPAVN